MATARRRSWVRANGSVQEVWQGAWRVSPTTEATKSGFATKKAALAYAQEQEAKVRAGTYIHRKGGDLPLEDLAAQWQSLQIWAPSTDARPVSTRLSHSPRLWGPQDPHNPLDRRATVSETAQRQARPLHHQRAAVPGDTPGMQRRRVAPPRVLTTNKRAPTRGSD